MEPPETGLHCWPSMPLLADLHKNSQACSFPPNPPHIRSIQMLQILWLGLSLDRKTVNINKLHNNIRYTEILHMKLESFNGS